ncbi:septal ring lytic transglycosylase RlpA family protein [Quatrionicoccus australiensis]|uniref:septal ring lytic transglycosylase RlpA family protein n=1 Tax=Quatrionicoccus australiensis TaxID=138118 RepID=UPI001CFAAA86|nr:septal ring lytic transglycosylase RlpA family protein [Quatrionicoccus australiensis]MCB4361137.1 septal ring lytic transglycosylase RlpA family protein [Quatrionicoccus australiensis]
MGGLLLLNVSLADAATSKNPSVKKVEVSARASARQAGKKPARSVVRGTRTLGRNNLKQRAESNAAPEVLTAEMKDDAATGLHGAASFYAYGFHGRRTATGEIFKVKDFTAASNHFPLGTMVAVRRLDSNLCAIVKVNDRMHAKHRKRIIDVSRGVAEYLDMIRAGVVLVRVAALRPDWREQGLGACQAAFEPVSECPSCAQPPRLPDFAGEPRE